MPETWVYKSQLFLPICADMFEANSILKLLESSSKCHTLSKASKLAVGQTASSLSGEKLMNGGSLLKPTMSIKGHCSFMLSTISRKEA